MTDPRKGRSAVDGVIRRVARLPLLAIPFGAARAQSPAPPPALADWTGAIRCEIQSQAAGYAHQETQTWTLAADPTVQGSVTAYAATWSVSGQGWHDRTRATSRRVAQWTVDVPAANPGRALVGFHLQPVGGRLEIARRNAQLTTGGGYTGPDQFINDGVPQPPARLVATVYEWMFPKIEAAASQTRLVGTNTAEVKAFVGPLQPYDARSIVACSWALGRGSAPPLPPPTLAALPAPTLVAGASPPAGAQPAPAQTTAPPAGASAIAGGSQPSAAGVVVNQLVLRCAAASFPQHVASPGGITFTFQRPPDIVGYRISRLDAGELTASPVSARSYTHVAPLEYFTTYQYDVIGVRADGTCTSASANITPPKPLTPQVSARVVTSGPTSRVTLSWGTQADRPSHYLVLGDGLPQDGVEVPASTNATSNSVETGSLLIGTHGWLVTPVWKTPVGAMIDVATGARVTATVGASAGSVLPNSIWDALEKATRARAEMLKQTIVPR